jgi:hypothetical protein
VRKPKDLRLTFTNRNENQLSKVYQRPSFRSNFFFALCLPSDSLDLEKSQTFILLHVLNILDVLEVSQFLELAKGLTFFNVHRDSERALSAQLGMLFDKAIKRKQCLSMYVARHDALET